MPIVPSMPSMRTMVMKRRVNACATVLVLLVAVTANVAAMQSTSVTLSVDWSQPIGSSHTELSFQIVHNPLSRRTSPIHDAVFENLRILSSRTNHIRSQFWYPYPHLVVAELDAPSDLSQCHTVGENATLYLDCTYKGVKGSIESIEYAAFGAETSYCPFKKLPSCYSSITNSTVAQMCLGKSTCAIPATKELFGSPCNSTIPLRLSVSVTCNPPKKNTYWNFTLMDELVEDTLRAFGDHTNIINLSTPPAWLFKSKQEPPHFYPDGINTADFHYQDGKDPVDPTFAAIGEYYGRLYSWYAYGGMTDEYGDIHRSGYNHSISIWEVMNEIDHEFSSVEEYTHIYDSVVNNIRKIDKDGKTQFMGLALAGSRDLGFNNTYFTYFLNSSNHSPEDTPLDWISYHYYSHPPDRTNVSEYEQFFNSVDIFIHHVNEIEKIRMALSPTTRVALDEVGVILPGDNNITASSWFPPIFVNAACAVYAYMYAQVTPLDISQIGNSQFLGFPNLPELGLTNQYPSLAIVNWTDGSATARFRSIEMLQQHLHVGDIIVQTFNSDMHGEYISATAYVSKQFNTQTVLLVNKRMFDIQVNFKGAAGFTLYSVDELTGSDIPRVQKLNSDSFILHGFSVSILEITSASESS